MLDLQRRWLSYSAILACGWGLAFCGAAEAQRRPPRATQTPMPIPESEPVFVPGPFSPAPFIPVQPLPEGAPVPIGTVGPPRPSYYLPPTAFRAPTEFTAQTPENPRGPRLERMERVPLPGNANPFPALDAASPTPIPEPPAELIADSRGYPLQILMSEKFINRLISRRDVQPGEIQDFILGAQVTGQQVTETRLRIDLRPSREQARGEFVLDGQIDGMTTGTTEQAMVNTAVQQQFHAVKEVLFDGERFSTRRAVVAVRAHNQTLNAQTALTGSFIGGIADSIAMRVAERRRPAAEAIARQKVADKVYPSFNGEVDKQLANANSALSEQVRTRLESAAFRPESQRLVTGETILHWAVRFPGAPSAEEVGSPPAELISDAGFNMCVHESLLNQIGGRAGLGGLQTTDRQLKDVADRLLRLIPGSEVTERPAAGALGQVETMIEFDAKRPLEFEARDDRMIVVIRATFKPAGQSLLPPLLIRIPFHLEPQGDAYELTHAAVTVEAENGAELPAVLGSLTQSAIEASLPKVRFPKQIPQAGWKPGETPPDLAAVHADAGWLSIRVE